MQTTTFRRDYRPYPYRLRDVALTFDLHPENTRVHARLSVQCAQTGNSDLPPLVLDGEDLSLISLAIDGETLAADDYQLAGHTLTLYPRTASFTLDIISTCNPAQNTQLMGLYVSGKSLFTQCEAQGFRRITWFADRPDVMATYRVTLRADKTRYPQLLSNGNLVSARDLDDGRHEAVWEDPHPKPCYLFALVAGDFACREQTITTRSGRQALLQIYSDHDARDQTEWALQSLVRAVRWDEARFGLELDLDRFMVVAARDFNMGAMENKGLNIFNAAYVLADPQTATDTSYRAIEAVIGHEYFHNWTGNRVTCRDWFQLSLKEGLTVFRDQEFSADVMAQGLSAQQAASARAVKRIDDVSTLRLAQFPEDAGPMAHPIRPESYQSISNFYTATVYEKGAEIIRMQHTLLGEAGFRAGMEEYFRRHDGQAVTCEDFVAAMEAVYVKQQPGQSLQQFRQWYCQAGTPRVRVQLDYDAKAQCCTITLTQSNPPAGIETRVPVEKPPLHIPFALGLLAPDGQSLALDDAGNTTALLQLRQTTQSWTFSGMAQRPTPSLLRGFSAPVMVEYERPDEDLVLLAQHDTDPYARWEAAQELASRTCLAHMQTTSADASAVSNQPRQGQTAQALQTVWRHLLLDANLTHDYRSRLLSLPSERELLEKTAPLNPLAVVAARRAVWEFLGKALAPQWRQVYDQLHDAGDYRPDPQSCGRRALRNLALSWLMAADATQTQALARAQYDEARNMTARLGGLVALTQYGDDDARAQVLEHFYAQWRHNPLVLDRWFSVQATAPTSTVASVRALMQHPDFSLRNPNRARALVFQFCTHHLQAVHTPQGYDFWAEQVLALDAINPEIAARLARVFEHWARFEPAARAGLHAAWQHIHSYAKLSPNVAEIADKALNAANPT